MDGESLDITKEKINALRQLLPEAFTEEKIDWEKLRATLGENINFSNERYVLNWAGKSDAFKVLQTPTTKTLVPAKGRRGGFSSLGGEHENREDKYRNSKNYFQLPYNPKLKERARELRQAGNLSEVLFWNQIKNKQFKGFDFDRQKIIGNYIVDFYCSNCNVVIEIDGSSHDTKVEYDAKRDAFLESLGLVVIHIPVADVMNNMSGVMKMLYDHPALKGTPSEEENGPPRLPLADTPPKEENLVADYYVINDGDLILLLENATQTIIDAVIAEKPVKVIALDRIFKENDQLKTNTVLQMRDAGVEFKTI